MLKHKLAGFKILIWKFGSFELLELCWGRATKSAAWWVIRRVTRWENRGKSKVTNIGCVYGLLLRLKNLLRWQADIVHIVSIEASL